MADKYRVILADPPWQGYNANGWRLRRRGIQAPRNHYDTMTLEDICAMPIKGLAAADAALFLWITTPHLLDAQAVMTAWGFRYTTTAFAWVKFNRNGRPYIGLGQYTRQNVELCLLGLRGRMARNDKGIRQVICSGVREHSRKPDQQYGRIMRLFDGPYLELFARQQWPGWDVWGNQTTLFPAQPFLFDEGFAA